MFKIVKNGSHDDPYKASIIADLKSDIADLPTLSQVSVGSTALVLEDTSVYMLGNDGEWHELGIPTNH